MAIDTAEKRRSAGGAFLAAISLPSVTNNASQDQEWRQQAGWTYSGILAAGAAPAGIQQIAWNWLNIDMKHFDWMGV